MLLDVTTRLITKFAVRSESEKQDQRERERERETSIESATRQNESAESRGAKLNLDLEFCSALPCTCRRHVVTAMTVDVHWMLLMLLSPLLPESPLELLCSCYLVTRGENEIAKRAAVVTKGRKGRRSTSASSAFSFLTAST